MAVLAALLVIVGSVPLGAAAANQTEGETPTRVAISEIQTPTGDAAGSPYAGQNVTTTGIVTGVQDSGFFVQNDSGPYSGVYVYGTPSTNVSAGDKVEVTGLVKEYNGVTEIDITASAGNVTTTGTGAVPAATTVQTGNASQERYEGVLVEVTNVTVSATPGQYGEWGVTDGSSEVRVDNVAVGETVTPEETGGTIDALAGPLHYSFGAFKIQPKTVTNYTAPANDSGQSTNGSTLTVLSYNDIQTAASDPTAMGRLVGAVNAREAAVDNPTVVVGGGDQVSPSSLSPVSNWTVPIQALNTLDPAAEVVGNHDLDYGFDAVENFTEASAFPWLVANIQQEDGGNIPGTKNYTVVERGNLSIGVVGLVDEAIKPKTAVDFSEQGYEVTDFVAAGDRIATKLKTEQNVDVVIAAAHIGVPESKQLARQSDSIDLIVTGDDEVTYPPQTTSGTVIMEAEARAAYLGEANLTVGANDTSLQGGRLIELGGSDYPVNETVNQTVADARSKYLGKVAGKTTVPLDSRFDSNYAEDTTWGNVIGDAFRAQTGADVAATNAGGIRGNFVIDPGNVTYDDVYTSLPFGNYLVTKQLTGEQLRELLASQVTPLDANYGAQAQLQVSGVTYEFVDRPGADSAVTDVHVNGEPLAADETYTVTLNSYMAGWTFGDRYGWNVSELPTVGTDYTLYGTAAVEYIESNSPISAPGVDRIRRVTRTVGNASVATSGSTVTLSFSVPSAVERVNASTVHVENATSGRLAAESATLSGGTLEVAVDKAAFNSLAAASETLELYGTYTDSELDGQRQGFSRSVLNGEVPASPVATQNGVTVSVGTANGDLATPLGSGTEVPVTAANVTRGVGAYELTLEVGSADVARITGFEPVAGASLQNSSVSADGTRVHVEVALADTADNGTVKLGTVELAGTTLGESTPLTVASVRGPYGENGTGYGIVATDGRLLSVTPGDLTGNGERMADPDGDGQFEDVNGDREVNIVDAQALFAERDSDPVTASVPAFDQNGDGVVDVGDVQALFASLRAA